MARLMMHEIHSNKQNHPQNATINSLSSAKLEGEEIGSESTAIMERHLNGLYSICLTEAM